MRTCSLALLILLAVVSMSAAAEITMKSGFILEGKSGKIGGLTENPVNAPDKGGEIDNRLIVLLDDGLRRSFICTYQVRATDVAAGGSPTKIDVHQRIAQGRKMRRIGMVGPLIPPVEQFDPWGRRKLKMATSEGNLTIIQGITEVTPTWTKVQGLMSHNPYQWDMRLATSSIPSSVLSTVLMNQIDKGDVDQRRQIVKLYIESERYRDANRELTAMFEDFPELKRELGDLARDLRQMSARKALAEINARQTAGQDRTAKFMLENFPNEGVAITLLGQVREKIEAYKEKERQGHKVLSGIAAQMELLEDPAMKDRFAPVAEEIKANMTVHTLDRYADFLRLVDSDKLKAEQKLSLAASNWILGSGGGTENLVVAMSLVETRDLVADYLSNPSRVDRAEILTKLRSQEGATPDNIARIIKHMKPPMPTDQDAATDVPGMFELTVPGLTGQADITYYVQLPPEYNPYRKYPAVVTLNGAGTTPQAQIDWWAGAYDLQNPTVKRLQMRLGQASRHGYIVIAPKWTKDRQRKYEYSAREHAAVLYSLRDAMKRFAIDSDRVFLSGHSMGGDAAWDIALAHPDVWAGCMPIVATTGKYVARYWENAEHVPLYFVGGQMDGDRLAVNTRELDRYLTKPGYDCIVVEYLGRGHEDFSDEIQRLFTWMNLHKRDFTPELLFPDPDNPRRSFGVNVVAMRSWDNFFWFAELEDYPRTSIVPPVLYDDRKSAKPARTTLTVVPGVNRVRVETAAAKATIYLSPELVDFDKRVNISAGGRHDLREIIEPSVETILEDVRTRGDREHPFWAKVEVTTGRR